jgi:hypothetical protein
MKGRFYLKYKKALLLSKLGFFYDPIEYFSYDKGGLVYVVNSKVACSSIKKSLMLSDGLDVNNENYHEIHRLAAKRGFTTKGGVLSYKNYEYFSVVRNPFARLVSFYVNKFQKLQQGHSEGFEFSKYLGGVFNKEDSFESVIKKVCNIPDEIADRHFKSQKFLLTVECKEKVKIFRIEDVGGIQSYFVKKNISSLGLVNVSPRYNYMDYYNLNLVEKIKERYTGDIDLFGYVSEYDKLISYVQKK